jgi:isopenicillin-N epimerase
MDYKKLFLLDQEITFLNFGSFGACPKEVFEIYQDFQLQLEREPVQFITRTGMELLASSRSALSNYLNCNSDDVVFMINPSYAINTIARSLKLEPGDEVLTTNLEYGAMDRTWNYYCERSGAKYVRSEINLPIESKEKFLADFWSAYTERTKVVFISQITSATGLILPVKEIVNEAKSRGLMTIIDGAHVPGHIELDIHDLDPDIYTGACHKWMMAPKGASFLYVKNEHQDWVDPLLISWGYQSDFPSDSQFLDYHQTIGTRDFSAFLTIPVCLEFMKKYNWKEVADSNKKRSIQIAKRIIGELNGTPISPLNEEWLGQMYSIPVRTTDPVALGRLLFEEFRIEIPVTNQEDRNFIRFSVQAFNEDDDYEKLLETMKELLQRKFISM